MDSIDVNPTFAQVTAMYPRTQVLNTGVLREGEWRVLEHVGRSDRLPAHLVSSTHDRDIPIHHVE